MGLADQNKQVHIGGGGGGKGERKIYIYIFFYKRLRAYPYNLPREILWEKQKKKKRKKEKRKKNALREVNKKLRFLRVCTFKSRQIYMNEILLPGKN